MISTGEEILHYKIQEQIKKCIQNVSSNSKYQHKLIVYFGLVSFFITLQLYCVNLFYMNPVFQCEHIDGKVYEEDACMRLNSCAIINTETITAQLHIYCGQRKHQRTLLQSTGGIGSLIVTVFLGLNDRIGKKVTFCGSMLILNLGWILQLVGTHFGSIPSLLLSELIIGGTNKGIYVIFIVLLTRFLKKSDYQWGTIIWFTAYHGLSQMAISVLNIIFKNWHAIAYVYAVGITICTVVSFFILKEDPVFLFEVGQIEETKKVTRQVGQQNDENPKTINNANSCIEILFEYKMKMIQKASWGTQKYDIREIMRCDIFQKILIISTAGFFYYLAARSIDLSIQSLEYSYEFNLFIVGLANTLGFVSASYVIKKEPHRKRGLIYTSFFYVLIALLILFPFFTQNGNVETVVIFALHLSLCWSCNFYARLKVDSFPEKYQMTILSVIEFVSCFGIVAAPSIVQKSVDKDVSPIVVVALLRLLIGIIPVFFLVEEKARLHSYQKQEQRNKQMEALGQIYE